MSEQDDRSRDALLHRLHDGELGEGRRAELAAGLSGEEREKLAALDEIGGTLRALCEPPAGFDAWPAVERGIAQAKVVPLSRRLLRRAPVWATTLAAAAAVAAVLLLPRAGGIHPSNVCDVNEVEVEGASATLMRLDDDTHGGSTTVLWLEE